MERKHGGDARKITEVDIRVLAQPGELLFNASKSAHDALPLPLGLGEGHTEAVQALPPLIPLLDVQEHVLRVHGPRQGGNFRAMKVSPAI
jgi:hypothetical protein